MYFKNENSAEDPHLIQNLTILKVSGKLVQLIISYALQITK